MSQVQTNFDFKQFSCVPFPNHSDFRHEAKSEHPKSHHIKARLFYIQNCSTLKFQNDLSFWTKKFRFLDFKICLKSELFVPLKVSDFGVFLISNVWIADIHCN